MNLDQALHELREAVGFFDRVKASSEDEKIAVGRDHWDWLESAARKVVNAQQHEPDDYEEAKRAADRENDRARDSKA